MQENHMSIDSNSNNSKSDHRNYFQRSCSTIYVAFSKGSLPLMGACFRPRSKLDDSDLSSSLSASGSSISYGSSSSSSVHGHRDKAKPETLPIPRSEGDILSSPNLKAFTFNELRNATRNFRPDNLLGQGGFGDVYKGWIDQHSLGAARPGSAAAVAVKMLKIEGYQGHKEWLSEVNYLGHLHHPNLVKLYGFCLDGDNRLLVYEYLSNGSLESHLFRRSSPALPWARRIKIAIDAARGLTFLHNREQQVIYRDFKASNVLLDSEFNAKLSDFGFAKAGPTGDHTHVSTAVLGTEGYAAPEYIATGWLTAKCDVYSFGVVLLELLSGRRVVDKTKSEAERNLLEWARPYLSDRRKLFRIMDTKLEGQYPQKASYIVAILALQCIGEAKFRPQMSEVLSTLQQLVVARTSARSRAKRRQVSGRQEGNQSDAEETSPLRNNQHAMHRRSRSTHISDTSSKSSLESSRGQSKNIGYSLK